MGSSAAKYGTAWDLLARHSLCLLLIDYSLDLVFLASILEVLVINHNTLVNDDTSSIGRRYVLLLVVILPATPPSIDISRGLGELLVVPVGIVPVVILPSL